MVDRGRSLPERYFLAGSAWTEYSYGEAAELVIRRQSSNRLRQSDEPFLCRTELSTWVRMAIKAPKHDAVWARELIAELEERGHRVESLLAEIGLSKSSLGSDGARITFAKHAALFELASEATDDNCLGLHFGQTRDTRDAGLIGYVGLSSPNLMNAIKSLSRYRHVFSDAVDVQLDALETRGRLRWRFRDGASKWAHQANEFSAANFTRAFREATESHIVPMNVAFAHARSSHIDEFERFFGCPVTFGRPANTIEMKRSDLHLPLVTADDRLLGVLKGYCQDLLARRSEQSPSLIERVESVIADRLTNGQAKLDVVASELGMSSRSLSRRLAELGTSFNALVEVLRKRLADRYLHDTSLSCTEIAFVLGYSDVSSFNHAYKRWSGETPTAARKSMPG